MNDSIVSPLVSIVMPTYNRANFIIETIRSVQDQTYKNWELVIVDDGSEDNTEELITELNDTRIKLYKAGRVGVVGKLKNIGIKNAGGDLIAFNDSDDLWAPGKLETQIQSLKINPEAGFSLTGGYNFRKPNEPIDFFYSQKTGSSCENILIPFFKSQISATSSSLLLWKKCLTETGLFDESKSFSDIDFILKLASNFKAVIVYEPLLYRRLHEDNHSNNNWMKGYHQGIEIVKLYEKSLPPQIVREALFFIHTRFGEDYLSHKKEWKAISNFLMAWWHKPNSIVPFKKTGKAIWQLVKN